MRRRKPSRKGTSGFNKMKGTVVGWGKKYAKFRKTATGRKFEKVLQKGATTAFGILIGIEMGGD